jgi:hypothetical protein
MFFFRVLYENKNILYWNSKRKILTNYNEKRTQTEINLIWQNFEKKTVSGEMGKICN